MSQSELFQRDYSIPKGTQLLISLFVYLCKRAGAERAEFSKYQYLPSHHEDLRVVYESHVEDVGEQLHREIVNLKSPHELAVHSKVKRAGHSYHIPMIDFASTKLDKVEAALSRLMLYSRPDHYYIFNSGRSFHAYGEGILSTIELYEFYGSLLLLNNINVSDVVDARWVGHRLIGGYSSLRISSSSKRHYHEPYFVKVVSREGLDVDTSVVFGRSDLLY